MSDEPLRALIVDDEPIPRMMIRGVLEPEDIICDDAVGCDDALAYMSARQFDVVVTDLRMPEKHGHSLVVQLLSRPIRPLVIVHSAITDPRLTRELINCGVDDVIYKPSNYAAFAAKVAIWAALHRRNMSSAEVPMRQNCQLEAFVVETKNSAAVDLYIAATSVAPKILQITVKISRDQILPESVLVAANLAAPNQRGQITDLLSAIRLIGLSQVADLSLDRLCDVDPVIGIRGPDGRVIYKWQSFENATGRSLGNHGWL